MTNGNTIVSIRTFVVQVENVIQSRRDVELVFFAVLPQVLPRHAGTANIRQG